MPVTTDKNDKEAPAALSSSDSATSPQADIASVLYSGYGTGHIGYHDAVSHPRTSATPVSFRRAYTFLPHFVSRSLFASSLASSHTCRVIVFCAFSFWMQLCRCAQSRHIAESDP